MRKLIDLNMFYKRKLLICLFKGFFLYCPFIFAQQNYPFKIPTKFDDYQIVANLDSLEQAVDAQKNTPSVFLHELIKLEINWSGRSDKSGQNLDTIKTLSEQQSSELGLMIYTYLKGTDLWKSNLEEGAKYCIKIIDFFEKRNDTLGMMLSYNRMITLNLSNMNNLRGSKEIARKYYDKIVELGKKSNRTRVRIMCLFFRSIFEHRLLENISIENDLVIIAEAEKLIAQNLEYEYLLPSFYTAIGIHHYMKKQFKELLYYHLKAHEYVHLRPSKMKIESFYNVGNAYLFTEQYAKAEPYTREAIRLYNESKEDRLEILIGMNKSLSDILFYQNKYQEAKVAWQITDSLRIAYREKLRSQSLLEIETKYETERKELENKRLLIESEQQQQRNMFVSIAAVFMLILSGVVFFIDRNIRKKNTELTRLNELAATQNQELNVANRQMEHFTNALSHDAITYIYHILNYTTLGQSVTTDTEVGHILQNIYRNASRLKSMSENLIGFNKTRRTTNFENFDLNEVIAEALEDMSFDIVDSDIQLEINDLPFVHANREFVKEVIRNLLGNAFKFRKKDIPLQLEISSSTHQDSNLIEIQIKDNGIGIPTEKLPIIFNEFTKVNNQMEGSGLGLFICRQILENMGGSIWVKSTQGEGSTFHFTLLKLQDTQSV